jgi:hypothetical protein
MSDRVARIVIATVAMVAFRLMYDLVNPATGFGFIVWLVAYQWTPAPKEDQNG